MARYRWIVQTWDGDFSGDNWVRAGHHYLFATVSDATCFLNYVQTHNPAGLFRIRKVVAFRNLRA
jgi:hypothetical protein